MKKMNVLVNTIKIVPVVLFATALVALNGCGGSGSEEEGKKSATSANADDALKAIINTEKPPFIMSVNAMQLFTKSNFENLEVPLDPMMWNMLIKNVKDPDKSGVDLNSKMYVMVEMGPNMEEPGMACMFMKVSSASAVKSHVSTFLSPKTEKKNGYTFGKVKGGAIGWNDSYAILVLALDKGERSNVVEKLDELMNTTSFEGESIALDGFLAENSDMGFYMNMGNMMPQLLGQVPNEGKPVFEFMSDLMKDGHTESHVYFEDNKIRGKLVNDYPAMADMKFLNDKGVSPEYTSFLTNDDLIGFYSTSVNVDAIFNMINNLIEKSGQADKINQEMAEQGFSMDMLKGLFIGDAAMSVTGLKTIDMAGVMSDEDKAAMAETMKDPAMAEQMEKMMDRSPEVIPNVIVTAGINNPDFFTTIFDTIPDMVKKGSYYSAGGGEANIMVLDNKLIITTDESLAQTIAANGSLQPYTKSGVDQAITGAPIAGYFNGDYWSKVMNETFGDDIPEEAKGFVKLLKEGKVWGNMSEINMEAEIDSNGENSLAMITRMMLEAALTQQSMKAVSADEEEEVEADEAEVKAEEVE